MTDSVVGGSLDHCNIVCHYRCGNAQLRRWWIFTTPEQARARAPSKRVPSTDLYARGPMARATLHRRHQVWWRLSRHSWGNSYIAPRLSASYNRKQTSTQSSFAASAGGMCKSSVWRSNSVKASTATPHRAMDQDNNACMSLLVFQRATRTSKRAHN